VNAPNQNNETKAAVEVAESNEVTEVNLQSPKVTRLPQYRRDIFPVNLVLSASDLFDFCTLIEEANERAKNIEYNNLNLSQFGSAAEARKKVNDLIPVEYNYKAKNGDSVQGLGAPKVEDRTFPEELQSFFVSNAAFTRRAINIEPLNVIDAFFSFEKPPLKLDMQTLPSNPTSNRSVINVFGRDEDWVISTTDRVQEFLRHKKSFRPVIHGSGAYDYFIYLAFLPALIWLLFKKGGLLLIWIDEQSVFLNVILGIYVLLISLLLARFIFQYVRWLFPPMEFYKTSRVGAYAHRILAGAVGGTIVLNALYDLVKSVVMEMF
jgi:hypothetical protein